MIKRLDEFEILVELGKGSYGRVLKVRKKAAGEVRNLQQNHDDKTMVLKQVDLKGMSEKDREETLNEVRRVEIS